ncbi:MAG: ubiquitin-conjugating enzyme E2 S [Sclerophora amabilis]|nr:MAG: ubiquitin-conjugating enzyme E2 S [Sclerophora amabilis]
MPEDYPTSPPKASFRTRIWHPNVEEYTGAVCVDTLKRDWKPELTIRDVLITISCLLIHPNPNSALNSSAGQLLQEDYDAFACHAKLMTSIHAPVSRELRERVGEAARRGEEPLVKAKRGHELGATSQSASETPSLRMRRAPVDMALSRLQGSSRPSQGDNDHESEDEDENEASASKENDPSLSPSPVGPVPPSPRKNILGKRPLSALPTPVDPDADDEEERTAESERLSSSERNVANNLPTAEASSRGLDHAQSTGYCHRKSLKLSERAKGVNGSGRIRGDNDVDNTSTPFSDNSNGDEATPRREESKPLDSFAEGKENITEIVSGKERPALAVRKHIVPVGFAARNLASRTVSASSNSSSGSGRSHKPRIGLRRL